MSNDAAPAIAANPGSEVARLSESLGKPLESLYKAGGFALVFVFVGLLSMLIGYLHRNDLSNWFFGIGVLITFFCVALFGFGQVYVPVKARRLIRENEELIDSIQEVAIKLTDTVSALQSLMFKHSEQISAVLESAAPVLANLPLIGAIDFSRAQNVNRFIVNSTEKSREVIHDVRNALVVCDIGKLKEYGMELENLRASLRDALSQEVITANVVSARNLAQSLQGVFLQYTEAIASANAQALSHLSQVEAILEAACRLPIVGNSLERIGGKRALETTVGIRRVMENSQSATENLRLAVSAGDLAGVQDSLKQVTELGDQIKLLRGVHTSEHAPQEG
jgi:hypothetical protein